jgi:hypothetical protein
LYTRYYTVTDCYIFKNIRKKDMNWELRMVSRFCCEYLYCYSYIRHIEVAKLRGKETKQLLYRAWILKYNLSKQIRGGPFFFL